MAKPSKRPDEQLDAPAGTESDVHEDQADESNREARDADRIARRAYERFQMRGAEHGRDQEDWFEAERELKKSERG
jgi:hypothetical protein